MPSRRTFLTTAAASAALGSLAPGALARAAAELALRQEPPFGISLAQWSLHRAHFSGALPALSICWVTSHRNDGRPDAADDTDHGAGIRIEQVGVGGNLLLAAGVTLVGHIGWGVVRDRKNGILEGLEVEHC